jgi:hypothetical protein
LEPIIVDIKRDRIEERVSTDIGSAFKRDITFVNGIRGIALKAKLRETMFSDFINFKSRDDFKKKLIKA